MSGPPFVVGVDIGGTGTRCVAVDPDTGTVVARSSAPTPRGGAAEAVAFLRDAILGLVPEEAPTAVGIGASGPIDASGVIRNPDTLPAFTGICLPRELEDLTRPPVVIDNDAVCAALGEHAYGASAGAGRSLHVTLGTGIGVCLLQGDVPFRYPDGSHPEAGHLTVAGPTPRCYCGRRSCWEQAASRQALQRTAAGLLGRAPDDRSVLGELADRAKAGEPEAAAVFATFGRAVADGLASLLTAYGPDRVVIGGSAAAYLELFRGSLVTQLARLDPWIPETAVSASALDDFGGALGAAVLAGSRAALDAAR